MIEALKIVHIAFAAAWFGHKLLIPRDVHDSIRDTQGAHRFVSRIKRAHRLGVASGVITVATGVWLVNEAFGFDEAPVRIWLGLAAAVLIFAVGAFLAQPAWRRIRSGVEAGDPASAAAGVAQYRQATRLENLLWIAALTSMVVT